MLNFLLGSRAKFEGTKEVTFTPDGIVDHVKVQVHNGRIVVKQAEQDHVQAIVHVVVKGELAEEIRDISDADRFWELEQNGGCIVFEQREFTRFYSGSSIKVSVELIVPKALTQASLESHNGSIEVRDFAGKVYAHSHNGSVDITRVHGDVNVLSHNGSIELQHIAAKVVRAETHHGSITLDTVTGDVELDTRHGSVETKNIDGALRLLTRNGSVRVDKVAGDLKAETHNGKIVVRECGKNVTLHTHNGSVRVQTEVGVQGPWKVSSHNGSIELNVPQDTNAMFQMHTSAGKVHGNAIPVQSHGYVQNIMVKKGDGEHLVEVETHRGSIEVSESK
ncbi:hypothetical protein CBW65_23920 [Tumebacillus avium]|uniref:DUF4097 domain-containing protein n=1 Tax=Tumebacillus avium TaxID=1903704 RepID=A0A1Y0IT83_9BACL|nr:DUF4097 family beta strand repeat-containing protein [Tumebacillus avium]ARU63731.1 hypothetical protein CBW65_23920 [Tumebacillus avium]